MNKKFFAVVILSLGIFIFGCSQSTGNAVSEKSKPLEEGSAEVSGEIDVETKTEESSGGVKELADNYYRLDKRHFENSLQSGKVVFLDFHADWCPVCAREQPEIFNAFNELESDNVVGYQVHYNDGKTTAADKEMAEEYGITYQHTKVIINQKGEVVLKSLEAFDKDKILSEINKVAGG